jgi:hypothetical protein
VGRRQHWQLSQPYSAVGKDFSLLQNGHFILLTRKIFQSIATVVVPLAAAALVVGPASTAQAASSGPWYLKPLSNSSLCVQPQSENLANLTKLELATCKNVGAQKWWFRDSASRPAENKLIVNGASHTCMNVRDAGGSGTPVVIYGCSDTISTRANDIFERDYYAKINGQDYYYFKDLSTHVPVFSGGVLGSDLITRDSPLTDGQLWTWVPAPA